MQQKKNSADIEKYGANMKEIKLRIEVVDLFLSGKKDAHYAPTTTETIGLQFRKIFELIAFASLAANREAYSSAYADFAKYWEASKLLKNLKKINPDFYPRPIIEKPSNKVGVVADIEDRKQDYLTQADLIEAHGRCGELLHKENPYARPIDYGFFSKNFAFWREKIINLLNSHQVHLLNDKGYYLFHMQEEGHTEIRWYRFEPHVHAA